ncbi:MAG: DUF4296 domain-containing protein [Bacteroidetes bacterium]|nr:DUF4296 domain-containing protein [Bacteroidota bacterium]
MRFPLFLLLVLGSLWACQFQNSAEKPSVSEEKMARIMADLAIADAATNGIAGYDKDSLMQVYNRQVFELHGITMEEHEKNLHIYANNSDQMKALLEKAAALLDTSKWQ